VAFGHETQAALEAVTRAAELCRAVRAELVAVDLLEKDDKSPVTVADFGAQALVCQRLEAAFPQDPIVGEEDCSDLKRPQNASTLAQVTQYVARFLPKATPEQVCRWLDASKSTLANRFWTLDPVDGTKGFLRNDQYAIALALIERGQVKVAVLGCPALPLQMDRRPQGGVGVVFMAVRGEGAAMSPLGSDSFVPIHVPHDADTGRLRFTESVEAAHGHSNLHEAIARAVHITAPALKMDSQAKYGAVARGDAALYLRLPSPQRPDYRETIWDHAAGSLIVEEAGGRVTDMYGQALDFSSGVRMHNNRGVVVSNGLLHQEVLAALAKLSGTLTASKEERS
jgi:3'(2'), 5'-bisphosphate nucleotidase